MSKYLELFKESFNDSINEKTKPEHKPYIGYSLTEGKVVYTVVPKEPTSAYRMVDLGLPSGLKWADRNVGAASPEENGLYFDWGNTEGHAVDENGNVEDGYSFDSTTYASTSGGQYAGSTLDAEHDAATANMGGDWRMPTVDEIDELIAHTDYYYIDLSGNILDKSELDRSKLRSICFVKKDATFNYNDRSNFIEIPFAGDCYGSLLNAGGLAVRVWSSSVYDDGVVAASHLTVYNDGLLWGGNSGRYCGFSVRGVRA